MDKSAYIAKVLSLCEPDTTLNSEYINASSYIELVCKRGHTRKVTTNNIVSKGGGRICKECLGRNTSGKKHQDTVIKEFNEAGYTLLDTYQGALVKVNTLKQSCGHIFLVRPSDITRKRNIVCPICFPSRRGEYTMEDFNAEILKLDLEPLSNFKDFKTNVLVNKKACGHIYEINPGHLLYNKIGATCKICNSIKDRFFTSLINNNMTSVGEYATSQTPIQVKNIYCGHEYTVTPNNLVSSSTGIVCRICNPTQQVSKGEIEIFEFITSIYDGWVIQSERQILNNGKELDIVIPDLGIAIEYNGSKWHSDECKDSTYHLDKTNEVESYGYQLIHISDVEWITNKDIVKSRLSSILGISTKIFARRTEIREISFPREFLNLNHIQGAGTPTKYNYGLYYKDELVCVMTFGTPRFNRNYTYELVRYCSRLGTTIVGGASKLLKYFRKQHFGSIISYADRRWSKGNLYKSLGFIFSHNSVPNYRYNKYKTSLSRYQCQKHLLEKMFPNIWEPDKSESTIMREAGYHKVYDCGNSVWTV